MTTGRQGGVSRAAHVVAGLLSLSLAACPGPRVGDRVASAAQSLGPEILLEGADVDVDGHVRATFGVTDAGLPVSLADVEDLDPRFTLATLAPHPVDGLPAWTSLLLTGSQSAKIRPSGPESDVLDTLAQPGSQTPAALVDLGGGRFRYVFASALPAGIVGGATLRVGVWLRGAASPSLRTSSTVDFTPSGAAPEQHDTVLDDDCNRCHGNLVAHGTRAGVKLCITCHTWQNADPDTIDPATMGTVAADDPNPMELGRLVHRIHRGRDLPTLYAATSTAAPPALDAGTGTFALPYLAYRGGTRRNPPVPGRKFSVIGYHGAETVFGWVGYRYPIDPSLAPTVVVGGAAFPRDLRDCDACHAGAPQASVTTTSASRRVCAGCHPEVWFGTAAITTSVHFAHTGGAQPDDAQCGGCHVAATASQPKVYAPIADVHVPPYRHHRYNRPTAELVSISGLVPGARPRIRFRLYDRDGPISPPVAPDPAYDTSAPVSLLPRQLTSLSILLAPAELGENESPTFVSSTMTSSFVADAAGVFTLDLATTVSTTATGIWRVAMEGQRAFPTGTSPPLYDWSTDAPRATFLWPYTGETFLLAEGFANPLAWVDTAVGTWTAGAATNAAAGRRTVVATEKCERCHDRLLVHGATRNQASHCLLCHGTSFTDWRQRPKVGGTGTNVSLGATVDGIEERSLDLKVLVHRIHTGGRRGASTLEGIAPFVVYGRGGTGNWFDGLFPGDLRDCTVCHEGQSYGADAVPAGARPTWANETATILHSGSRTHPASEPGVPPIQAACLGCHASGATVAHAASHTSGGVEGCTACHAKGATSVDVAHGLATGSGVTASFSSIVQAILVPACATSACHSGAPLAPTPRLDTAAAAYAALVGVQAEQASMKLVEPGAPEKSYLMYKLRGDAASAGGTPSTPMPPTGGLLGAADLAAVEAWIANGAPND